MSNPSEQPARNKRFLTHHCPVFSPPQTCFVDSLFVLSHKQEIHSLFQHSFSFIHSLQAQTLSTPSFDRKLQLSLFSKNKSSQGRPRDGKSPQLPRISTVAKGKKEVVHTENLESEQKSNKYIIVHKTVAQRICSTSTPRFVQFKRSSPSFPLG